MPYDPRMLQMAQMGVGMMGPPQGDPFARNAPKPKQWWEQPLPRKMGEAPQDDPANPDDPNAPKKKPQPSLLQMLMLGGQPTYSGTPRPTPPGSNPWGWLGGMGGGYK